MYGKCKALVISSLLTSLDLIASYKGFSPLSLSFSLSSHPPQGLCLYFSISVTLNPLSATYLHKFLFLELQTTNKYSDSSLLFLLFCFWMKSLDTPSRACRYELFIGFHVRDLMALIWNFFCLFFADELFLYHILFCICVCVSISLDIIFMTSVIQFYSAIF